MDPMGEPELNKLDNLDKVLRREAMRKGKTHHLAKLPAVRRDGRVTGRV